MIYAPVLKNGKGVKILWVLSTILVRIFSKILTPVAPYALHGLNELLLVNERDNALQIYYVSAGNAKETYEGNTNYLTVVHLL